MAANGRDLLQNDELRLDLYSIIRALLKDWWMILTAGLVGIFCAYLMAGMAYTPVYTSSMTFIVSSKGATSNLSDLTAANSMAETFGQVLNSRLLKKKVQQELELDYMPGTIETTVVEGTNLMTLKVSAPSPQHSFQIMKSVLNNYSEITGYVLNNVVLDVLEAPEVPKAPSNPISARDMMKKYAVAGMALMVGILALIDYLRDNVKNEKEVERKLDTPLFASIYHENKNKTLKSRIRKTKKGLLVTDPTNSFLFVETYKKIRTKLMYKSDVQKSRVILVTSVMENEGKSTVAVNLALTLAQKAKKVLLVDGDMRRPASYKILQKTVEQDQEIGEYLNGKIPLDRILQRDKRSGLYMLIGSRHYPNSTEMVSGEAMHRLMSEVQKWADYVVIDSPPTSLMADAEVMAEYADVSLLVVRQGMARTRDINDAIDMLENGNSKLLGCIYNDVKTGVFSGKKTWGGYGYGGYRRYGRGYGYGRYGRQAKPEPETSAFEPASGKTEPETGASKLPEKPSAPAASPVKAESSGQTAGEPKIEIPDLAQGLRSREHTED